MAAGAPTARALSPAAWRTAGAFPARLNGSAYPDYVPREAPRGARTPWAR